MGADKSQMGDKSTPTGKRSMKISGGTRRIVIDLVVVALMGVTAWLVLFHKRTHKPPKGIESIELTVRRFWDPLSADLEDWQIISVPRDILWIPPGEILVSDTRHGRVIRLKITGELIEIIGRPGGGPGEFGEPWDLAHDKSTSTLWVGDRQFGRMSVSRFRLSTDSSEFIDRIHAQQFRIQSTASLTLTDSITFWINDPFQWRIDLNRIHRVGLDGSLISHFGEIYIPEGEQTASGRDNEGLLEAVGIDTLVFFWRRRPLVEVWSTQGEKLLEKLLDLPEVNSLIEYVDWINRSGRGPRGENVGDAVPTCWDGVDWQSSTGYLYVMTHGVVRQGLTPMEPLSTNGIYAFNPRTMEPEKRYYLPEFSPDEFYPLCFTVNDIPEKPCFYSYDFINSVIVALEPK